ncbi:class I SAM-dependent methyltransferase [Streptomyces sp. NPDC006798]|uniref:class I SAM-dependent methyltransferase n=1 Tax=Streptomyces sp. NPDC006798 TaxID=3155462 RepID=UPI0033D3643C
MPSETPSHLRTTADAYDGVAQLYADLFRDELDGKPIDRGLLAEFAAEVRESGGGAVAEVGCGPGRIAAHLRGLGTDVFGIDLSPEMIRLAREAYPELRFEVGSMAALDLADGALGGLVAWYSMIHTPPEEVPSYFGEFRRVLAPGGRLLLAFYESGDDPLTVFDHKVTPAYRWPADALARTAAAAGFTETDRIVRLPREGERFRQGRLMMRLA